MYRHKKLYEIRYTDADAFDNLKLSSLLSFLEESACLSADELGFGYSDITPKNIGFIIVNWYIELSRPVKLSEKLEVHTWPLAPKHIVFNRDFELFVKGEKVGVATARWCMIDTQTFAMLPINAFFKDGDFDDYNTERSVVVKGWKIPSIGGGEVKYSKPVTFSDYDHYFHVNNTKYADFMSDVFSVEELNGKFMQKIQISYNKQCKLGERIDFYRSDSADGVTVEGRVGEELRVQMKVTLTDAV